MNRPLTIVADAHIWAVESAFSVLPGFDVDLRVIESKDMTALAVRHADVLLTRSSTRVNASLLEGSKVRFVATATIGDDHFDKGYLKSKGIRYANAAGSSTGSVVEYVITALLELHVRGLIDIAETRIGIIGAGRIGGRLQDIFGRLGMRVLVNDPPRARKERGRGFVTLRRLLDEADVISLHTPLTRDGPDATWHLIGKHELSRFRGRGLMNTGRGDCVDNAALAGWLDADAAHFAVLDCWEGEPNVSHDLLSHPQVAIATPHIAGHSLDGKAANSQFIHDALCAWLGIRSTWNMHDSLPAPPGTLTVQGPGSVWSTLHRAAIGLYPIEADDTAFRRTLRSSDPGRSFVTLRRHYPPRRAWNVSAVHFDSVTPVLERMATAIGLLIV